jgi:type II secretory pathway predicted ATPase ExeA
MSPEHFVRLFSLSEPPFSKELSDADLWLPPSKQALVDDVREAVEQRMQILLTGEPGVGKTCVLRALRRCLSPADYRLTYCHNATLGRRDFYRQLCVALGLAPAATAASVFYAVSSHVENISKERIHPVFLLDEAHLLHQDTLNHLHVLLNYDWDSRALLSLILVGLPELKDRLELRKNRSLYSRIHCRLSIDAMTADDTADYVRIRLRRVGCERDLFAAEALTLLHQSAGSSLREVDRLASAALRETARRKKKLVDRDVMARVAGDLPADG